MILKKVCLNVWRNAHEVVTAVQGEIASRFVQITLFHYNEPLDLTEKTVAIYMTKPDRTIIYNRCEIVDAANGIIMVALTSQMSAVAGTISDCEVHVIGKDDSLLKILGLTIVIDRSVEDTKAIESSNEMTLLLESLKNSDGILEKVTESLQEKLNQFDDAFANQAAQISAEVNQMLANADTQVSIKLQEVEENLSDAEQKLQQALTDAQQSVQSAVSNANLAADRANSSVEKIEQAVGELVNEVIEEQKNKVNGIAGLDSNGKLNQMPTAIDIGAVPTTRTVNNKALSGNITLTATDVNAVPTTRTVNNKALSGNITLTATDVNAVPTTRTVNNKVLSGNITLTAVDVDAVPTTRTVNNRALSSNITLTATDVNAVPITRTVNGQALSSNITLTAANVSAVPTTRTVNGKYLSSNITLTVNDIGVGNIFLAVYPVGSIYMTTVSTNPGTLFGGTWVAWGSGRVPVGVNTADSDFNTVNKTGGSKTHTLTVNEIPNHSHTHSVYWSGAAGSNYAMPQGLETNDPREYQSYPSTGGTGGGQPHNNLQPYITCYMWRRTA